MNGWPSVLLASEKKGFYRMHSMNTLLFYDRVRSN